MAGSSASNFPWEPGQAHIFRFTFIPTAGSEGTTLEATASITYGSQSASTGPSTTEVVGPLTDADVEVDIIDASPTATGVLVTCSLIEVLAGTGELLEFTVVPQSVPDGEGAIHSNATVTDIQGAMDSNPDNDSDQVSTSVVEPSS